MVGLSPALDPTPQFIAIDDADASLIFSKVLRTISARSVFAHKKTVTITATPLQSGHN